MNIKGFAHCALYTSRLEETVRFYTEVFGARNLGYFQASTRGCWLQLGEDILEVFESDDLGCGCFKHIAIACDDVDGLYTHALACGAGPVVAPKDAVLALQEPVKARLAFVSGINGEEIELFCTCEA